MGSDARAAAGARRTDRAKPIAKKSAVKRAKAPAPSKRRGTGHMGLVLAAFVVAAALLYLSGGTQSHTGTPGADAEIAASRAMLTQLAQQAPVDLTAELKRQRKEELKAKNGLLVDDLEAEKLKILAMTDADWSKADITRWFENAAIVGDSIIRQVRLFHFLDAPVFAEGGIHISVELPLLDEVEAAAPSVIFLCFGMNDVGVFEDRVDRYVGRYTNVIRRLQASLPEAVIYVCAALPVTPERLAEERAQLLQQTRDLAFANYKTFIRGAECTERIHRLFGDVEESLGRLLDRLPSFQQSCRCGGPGARGAFSNCNSCLYDDRNT